MAPNTFLDPDKIFKEVEVRAGMVIADFGAGSGFFSLAAAKKVGREGRVFAIDVLESSLEAIESRAKSSGLVNIQTTHSDLEKPEGSKLKASSCDFVLVSNILFQAHERKMILAEAYRILKSGGQALIIDWIPEKMSAGKDDLKPLPKEEANQLALEAGFSFLREIPAGSHHYGLLFKK
jgi:ubiquinone/menaquinone biosynthesis C-methylase UbiE